LKKLLCFLFKLFWKGLLTILALVGLYFLTAWICSHIAVNDETTQSVDMHEISILSNGVHTDIVFPVRRDSFDWRSIFPLDHVEDVDSTFAFVAFGWGDKGFFLETPTWGDLKFSTAFKAAFFLSTSAMHVTHWKNKPVDGGNCMSINITNGQFEQLKTNILASFENNIAGKPIRIDHKGYSNNDCFYEAHGTYSFLNTCNVWTGRTLRESGVRTACWTPFDWGVFEQLQKFEK